MALSGILGGPTIGIYSLGMFVSRANSKVCKLVESETGLQWTKHTFSMSHKTFILAAIFQRPWTTQKHILTFFIFWLYYAMS